MAITTQRSQVKLAKDVKAKATPYFVFGKTSAWDDDKNPPAPKREVNALSEIIGYKKVSTVSMCRPKKPNETSNYQTVYYNNQEWLLVPDANAETENATYIYYEVDVLPSDFPLGTYRQVGLQFDVKPKTGVTKSNLLPTELSSAGYLYAYENSKPVNRIENVTINNRFILSVTGK